MRLSKSVNSRESKIFLTNGEAVKELASCTARCSLYWQLFLLLRHSLNRLPREVIFVSPCECQGFHGKNRWIPKVTHEAVRTLGTPQLLFATRLRCQTQNERRTGTALALNHRETGN